MTKAEQNVRRLSSLLKDRAKVSLCLKDLYTLMGATERPLTPSAPLSPFSRSSARTPATIAGGMANEPRGAPLAATARFFDRRRVRVLSPLYLPPTRGPRNRRGLRPDGSERRSLSAMAQTALARVSP